MVRLAPDVWAAVVTPRPPAYAFANSLVVLSEDGVLVVDTQQSPTAARALVSEIRARTDAPVRWVVNTHWHADHVFGNQVYLQAWPAVSFVAHRTTREDVDHLARAQLAEQLRSIPDRIAQRERWLDAGRGPEGEALTPEQLESVRYSLAVNQAYLRDLRQTGLVLPDIAFDDSLTIHVGPHPVQLLHVGPAHTRGDVVVRLPDLGIVAVGDLIEAGLPYLEHGSLQGWARALDRVRSMSPTVVLGAHADPDRGSELLEWQGDFFRELTDRVDQGLGRGLGKDALVDGVRMEDFQERFAALGVDEDAYRSWLRVAVKQAAEQSQERSRD